MAIGARSDDECGFGSGGSVESCIADVGAEDGGVRRVCLRKDVLGLWGFCLVGETFEE